jgi:hypothetical protein
MDKDEALRLALEALEYEAQKGNDNAYQFEREAIKAALEAKDELVQWKMGASGIGGTGVIVQQQRTWVGLTDEDEIDWEEGGNLKDLVKAIEAKLKDKNT